MKMKVTTARRGAAVLVTIVSVLLTTLTMAAPQASAHSGDYEHDDVVLGTTCPSGTVPNGSIVDNLLNRGPAIGCTHPGYSPVGQDPAMCEEARGRLINGWCTYDRARPCGTNPAFTFNIGDGMCLRLALIRTELLPQVPRSRTVSAGVPVCAESSIAQESAQGLAIGDSFWDAGVRYFVVTGEPTCTVNCIDGWDMNCDGKIGDFCASEYDLTQVIDLGSCIADLFDDATSLS